MQTARTDAPNPVLSRLLNAVIMLHIALGLMYAALWIATMMQGNSWRADFSAYYTGWVMLLDGQGRNLYDLALQTTYQQEILEGRSFAGGLLRFNNPPHVAVLLAPLGLLPRETAFLVWTAVQVGLLGWLLRLLWQLAREWQPRERLLLVSAVVAFPPLLNTFFLGAFSLWVLVCLVQFYLLLKQGRDTAAGVWLALGTFKPQIVFLPGFLLLGARRWRALGGAIATGVGLFLLCTWLLGWQVWLDYLDVLRGTANLFAAAGVDPTIMYNFKGALTLLLGSGNASLINQVSTLALGITVLITLWLWRGPWRPAAPDFEPRFALTLMLALLFSLHLNPHDGIALVVPAALFYAYLRAHRPTWSRPYAVFALSSPLLFLFSEFAIEDRLGIRVPVVVMLVLTGWLIAALRAEHRAAGGTASEARTSAV